MPVQKVFDIKDFVVANLKPKNQEGYKEGRPYNQWISQVLGFEAILIRSHPNRSSYCVEDQVKFQQGQDGDSKSLFHKSGALHLINKSSVDELREVVKAKYSGTDVEVNSFDETLFRPNIVINTEVPYLEEEIYQARIGNMLLR